MWRGFGSRALWHGCEIHVAGVRVAAYIISLPVIHKLLKAILIYRAQPPSNSLQRGVAMIISRELRITPGRPSWQRRGANIAVNETYLKSPENENTYRMAVAAGERELEETLLSRK